MTLDLYIKCGIVGLLGMLLQIIFKSVSIQKKAKLANVQYKFLEIFTTDWLSHTAGIVTIILFMFLIDEFTNISAKVMDYVKIGFAFVGYSSNDIASRLFSVVNDKVNKAIDFKTNISDSATGTLNSPTPK